MDRVGRCYRCLLMNAENQAPKKGAPFTKQQNTQEEIPSRHWADQAADELIKKHDPGKIHFTCASGISPSGVVHIGNFREVITVDFVVRSLRSRGKTVRFLYSWDDYDALRKVPANLPNPKMIEASMRLPLALVPDPFGTQKSYAAHFESRFQAEIEQLGVYPEYLYQNERYRACHYADGIRTALINEKKIIEILNKSRTSPLPANWSCVSVFSKETGKDTTTVLGFEAPSTIRYRCEESKKELTVNFETEPGVKLLWRVDWPMRWAKEGVDFEPGGKDHSSTGGSFDTGKEIVAEVWKKEAPFYVQYDFVLAKGLGSKLSSSSGNLITLSEALEVYEPAVVRWLFASRKPNLDFSIAFDLDVMKAYDEFDRTERYAYGAEPGDEKKVTYEKRIYELSIVKDEGVPSPGKLPSQFPFRHLCNLLQIHEANLEKVKASYADRLQATEDHARFESRAKRAWTWIDKFAPEEFKFRVRTASSPKYESKQPVAVGKVAMLLESDRLNGLDEDQISNSIYTLMKECGLDAKTFFPEIYQALIGKNMGPKLGAFVLAIGPKRAADILKSSL